MILSGLERRRGHISPADLCNCARTVWPGTTIFGKVTCREGVFLRGQPRPSRKGAGPQRPPNVGTSVRAHGIGNSNQILRDRWSNYRCEEYFYRVDHAPLLWSKFLVSRIMQTRDPFAVAVNFLFYFVSFRSLFWQLRYVTSHRK